LKINDLQPGSGGWPMLDAESIAHALGLRRAGRDHTNGAAHAAAERWRGWH
jgi:hypothetical protein